MQKAGESGQLRGIRVLVVDDHADTRLLLRRVLQLHGAVVDEAKAIDEALVKLEREKYDVLVSDLGFPERDGFELIRNLGDEIERHRSPPGKTPAVALTGYADEASRRAVLGSGYQVHVAKPVDHARLVRVIACLAEVDGPAVERGQAPECDVPPAL